MLRQPYQMEPVCASLNLSKFTFLDFIYFKFRSPTEEAGCGGWGELGGTYSAIFLSTTVCTVKCTVTKILSVLSETYSAVGMATILKNTQYQKLTSKSIGH